MPPGLLYVHIRAAYLAAAAISCSGYVLSEVRQRDRIPQFGNRALLQLESARSLSFPVLSAFVRVSRPECCSVEMPELDTLINLAWGLLFSSQHYRRIAGLCERLLETHGRKRPPHWKFAGRLARRDPQQSPCLSLAIRLCFLKANQALLAQRIT